MMASPPIPNMPGEMKAHHRLVATARSSTTTVPTNPNTMRGPCISARRTETTGAETPSSSSAASTPQAAHSTG